MARTKNINGKDWVIIKNFRRHQQTLMKGNKWGANNPQAVKIGLGLNDVEGAMRYVKFNAGVEVFFGIGINAVDYILRDEATLTEFGVNSASDITKGMVSLVGAGLATAMLPATIGVLATGVTFAFISFLIAQGLNAIDEDGEYTKRFIEFIEGKLK